MTETIYPASIMCDMYKLFHREQYPKGTTKVYTVAAFRSNKHFPRSNKVVNFGGQAMRKKYIINYFNEHFFSRKKEEVILEYVRFIKCTTSDQNPDFSHVAALHDLGYLPIKIKALPEGFLVPMQVPVLTIENTIDEFFWVANFLETLISSSLWMPSTNATVAKVYRDILEKYAMETVGHIDDVDFQAHDFSFRSQSSPESGIMSGAAHLTSFKGSDTAPAGPFLEKYYNANMEKEVVLSSIPATEHAVACANTRPEDRDEYEAFKKLITVDYPEGFVSIVSDTYDFYKVLGETLPRLKEIIMNRNGKVVIRPDSGSPVKIITGDPEGKTELERKGAVEVLYDLFGGTVSEQGYKVLDSHIGLIYGDGMTHDVVEEICQKLKDKGFATTNVVLGIGGYSYHFSTSRDSFSFATKATYAVINGEERMLFKDPVTDPGKRSHQGLVGVHMSSAYENELVYMDGLTLSEYNRIFDNGKEDILQTVFEDGKTLIEEDLSTIRWRLSRQKIEVN